MLKKLMTLGAIVMFAPLAFGQQSDAAKQLTLQDCIRLAVERNASVLQAQYQAQSQGARVLSAYGNLLPTLSANGQFSYQDNNIESGITVGGVLIPFKARAISRRYSTSVSANYDLFDGFANYASLNSARSLSQSAGLAYKRTKQSAVYQTTQLYLSVFQARDQLKVVQDNLKRDQRQLESIMESNKVGSASLADVYQQQVAVSNDEYQLVQAQNSYDNGQANLKFYLGIKVTDNVVFGDPTVKSVLDTTEFTRVNQQFDQTSALLDKAYETRPDYQAAIENVNASRSSLAVANAAYSPTVSAFAQYGLNGPQTNQITQNANLYMGLSVSLPIFNGFQTQTGIEVAKANLETAKQNLDVAKRQVQLDVYQAMLNLHAAEKQYEAAVRSIASAKINLETAQEKYRIGGATLLDVLTANASYTTAETNQVVAAYGYINAKQAVEFALGTINY
ncbi:MAG: TolC family protein [Bacteroidetes bacterium]|nr:TolC family protein [Bacteroidota bacterium]MCL5738747.1 TolC family protein [Bacteroidota bacterium]